MVYITLPCLWYLHFFLKPTWIGKHSMPALHEQISFFFPTPVSSSIWSCLSPWGILVVYFLQAWFYQAFSLCFRKESVTSLGIATSYLFKVWNISMYLILQSFPDTQYFWKWSSMVMLFSNVILTSGRKWIEYLD